MRAENKSLKVKNQDLDRRLSYAQRQLKEQPEKILEMVRQNLKSKSMIKELEFHLESFEPYTESHNSESNELNSQGVLGNTQVLLKEREIEKIQEEIDGVQTYNLSREVHARWNIERQKLQVTEYDLAQRHHPGYQKNTVALETAEDEPCQLFF